MGLHGRGQHQEAVARLQASYAALPPDAPVRLAKTTTNLFRPRGPVTAGLDVSGLDGVVSIDPHTRTAEVQGMCTYEDLVAETLAYGMIPLVVPQLRTITLGGAVTGLGIEATSFRNGLPHESVLEMDVFTGSGEVVTASRERHEELFRAFPNSYGSLGYATRLRIELEPVPEHVALRHLRLGSAQEAAAVIEEIVGLRTFDGVRVDGLEGVAFAPDEVYLTLATWTDRPVGEPSTYTGQRIYYRSLQERSTDLLTMHDYLWRWDTDWFWCSGAFGAQHPLVRRLWPSRLRRSDVYMRLLGLDRRFGIADRLDRRAGRPQRERVVQDVEVPADRLADFLDWFDEHVGMRPVWLCPLRLREPGEQPWPTYPLRAGTTYVNVGFWGTVHVGPEATAHPTNRAIEQELQRLGGHKSLYSEAFYDPATFARLYDTDNLDRLRKSYDPESRLPTLYDKAVT